MSNYDISKKYINTSQKSQSLDKYDMDRLTKDLNGMNARFDLLNGKTLKGVINSVGKYDLQILVPKEIVDEDGKYMSLEEKQTIVILKSAIATMVVF